MLKNRPITFFGVFLCAGIVTGLFFSLSTLILVLTIAVSGVLCFILAKNRLKYAFIALLGISVGILYSSFYCNATESDNKELCGKELHFTALVQNISPHYSDKKLTLLVTSCDFKEAENKQLLMFSSNDEIQIGDSAICTAKIEESSLRDKADGFYLMADGEIDEILTQNTKDIKSKINLLRLKISNRIGQIFEPLSKECASFFKAVLIGDRSGIDTRTTAKFSRVGISHLLAISGLHFTVTVATLYNLLFFLTGRKKLCSAFAIVFAVVYAVLCGASPSVIRAAFMCCFAFGTQIFMFKNDSFHSLALALLALLVFNPYSALSISLQLSFLSCVGVLFISPFVIHSSKDKKSVQAVKAMVSPILYSISATVASLPVLFYNFDFISIAAPVANIAVSLLATPLLFLGALCLLVSSFWLGGAQFLAYIPYALHEILMTWVDFFASSKYACVSFYIEGLSFTVVLALTSIASALVLKKKNAIKFIATCFCLIVITIGISTTLFSKSFKDNTLIKFKDTDSGALLVADFEHSAIFDLGGKSSLSSFAVKNGFTHLDYYFLSSYSENSVFRLKNSLSALSVSTLVLPNRDSPSYTISAFEQISDLADESNCAIMFTGERFDLNESLSVYTGADLDLHKSFALTAKEGDHSLLLISGTEPLSRAPLSVADHLVVSKSSAKNASRLLDSLPRFVKTLYRNEKSNDGSGIGAVVNLCSPKNIKTYKTTISFKFFNDGSLKLLD